MIKIKRHDDAITFTVFFTMLLLQAHAQRDSKLELWYRQPAGATWENALPIGNGRLGAMVYGNVPEEIIQLNEHTIWSGSPYRNDNALAAPALPTLRSLINSSRQKEAETMANRTIISKNSHGQIFQPAASLHLLFGTTGEFTRYRRSLDIERAVVTIEYEQQRIVYKREVFASLSDSVIVVRLTANKPKSISFSARYTSPHVRKSISTNRHDLVIEAMTSDHEGIKGKVAFKGVARIIAAGGKVSTTDSTVMVKGANQATILISIGTNFRNYHDLSGDGNTRALANIDRASTTQYQKLLERHVSAYQKYFNRTRIDLGSTEAVNLPIDERLRRFNSVYDPQFVSLYFQFGRYLLISSSQPGGQPANLQGIWNNQLLPPWDSKYTININAEMNYWPAEKTSLPELHEPFLRMVEELSETGRETAKVMYNSRGWMAHHNTDIWRATGAVDGAFWGAWTGGGGWTSQHLWEHFLYSGDKIYLKRIYPILKGAAQFYADVLVPDPSGRWMFMNPDMSPENAPTAHQGSSLDAGTTMTNQIIYDSFSSAIRAASLLGIDADFSDSLKHLRSKLSPMRVGRHGQLQEWMDDIDDPSDKHRHVSHLYGLFPSNQISPYRTPELYRAAIETLNHRGDVSTGWSMGWKVNWWARALDGDHAFKLIKDQLTPVGTNEGGGGTYNNLFDAHPPFQIDGNFGCTSGIAEMLIQSADGFIYILPALPKEWNSGQIQGIRARGGFEIVDLQWRNYHVEKLVIKSVLGGLLRIRVPNDIILNGQPPMQPAADTNDNPFYYLDSTPDAIVSGKPTTPTELPHTLLYDTETVQGRVYVFSKKR